MNLGTFTGRLGKDATMNRISSGDPVANFSVAVDVGSKQAPKTMWVECAIYGKRAEALQQYLTKAKEVTVHGRLTMDTFTGKDGVAKNSLKLNVLEINLHGGAAGGQGDRPAAAAAGGPINDDDMPF